MEDGGDCEQHAAHRSVRVVGRQRTLNPRASSPDFFVSGSLHPAFALVFLARPSGNKHEQRPDNLDDQPDNAA